MHIHLEFSGEILLEDTPHLIQSFLRVSKRLHAHFMHSEYFALQSCLYDMLSNALTHGKNPIRLVLDITPGEIAASLTDSGEGFDYRAALERECSTEDEHGRGLHLIRELGFALAFNDKGNEITIRLARRQQ